MDKKEIAKWAEEALYYAFLSPTYAQGLHPIS